MIRLIDYGNELGVSYKEHFSWHLKADVSVSSSDGLVTLYDKGEVIVSESPENYLIPKESSIKDLVLLIKNFFLKDVSGEVVPIEDIITIEDIYNEQLITNSLLDLMRKQNDSQEEILNELKICSKYLRKIYNPQ